ncbi:MAG: bifunctional demethylmenaquinone methyltransferase/2-methoxy-6-polyprenyl-1,4-benzoquinol methylase UbiE [Niabella sp.]
MLLPLRTMSQLPHDTIKPFEASGKSKKEQVTEMFDRIAGKYDFMNRFLSARMDVRWRKKALLLLEKYHPQQIIDIATGTGDLAIMANKMLLPQKITGIDISAQMLEVGRKKINKLGLNEKIVLQKGDSEDLSFASNSFDAATAAFGVRNFQNLEKGLSEIYRVLNNGGQLMVLEFSKPKSSVFSPLYKFYMNIVAPQFAQAFTKNKEAYEYLNKSSQAFPERENFLHILKQIGFINAAYKPLTMGICCIYTAQKPM